MGSFGSTRWCWHQKHTTVEESLALDLGVITRSRPSEHGPPVGSRAGKEAASIAYATRPDGDGLILTLRYTWKPLSSAQEGREVTVPVRLERQPMRFGGFRWWGRCPLMVDGRPCNRRVRKLYPPPGAEYFGCRECYNLTYQSGQEHDKRVDALRKNPGAIDHLLATPRG